MKKSINVKLSMPIERKLRREAVNGGRTIEQHAEYVLETWINENMAASMEAAKQIGEQLGQGIVAALEDAERDIVSGKSSLNFSVRVKRADKKEKKRRALK